MGKYFAAIAAIILIASAVDASPYSPQDVASFNGYQVIRVQARTEEQGMALIQLQRNDPALDFWKEPSVVDFTDIMANSDSVPELVTYLESHGIQYEILIEDVGKVIASQTQSYPMQGVREPISWTKYHSLDTVYEWFGNLSQANSYIEVINIGKSYEGVDLKVVKLSKSLPSQRRPAIFIDSAIHAREWISLATTTFMMNELVNNPEDNALLNEVDFYFMPIINTDGYIYTLSTNRMWRKTRSPNGGTCYGVDANRNFGYEWDSCSGCSSGSCSSETFRGPQPFSEPEAEAMRVFIEDSKAAGVNFQSYISVHSYGQYFMHPWGYTSVVPPDHDELQMVGNWVAGNITAVHGTPYTTGPSSTTIYPTDGTSQDYAYGSGIFKYTYTAELRDKGVYGFLLPAEQIIPTAEETWAGFKVVVKHIIGK